MLPLLWTSLVTNFAFLCAVYYVGGALLQFVVPQRLGLHQIQTSTRPPGQMRGDAIRSLG